jgi:hypothetical protein
MLLEPIDGIIAAQTTKHHFTEQARSNHPFRDHEVLMTIGPLS